MTFGRRNCVGQGWVRDRRKIRGIDVYRKAEDEGRAYVAVAKGTC